MKNPPKMPEWLTENPDGSITVSFAGFARLPQIDGTEVTCLKLREPSAQDQITAQKAHSTAPEAEVALIANLAEVAPDAIGQLKLKQYYRCQAALEFFTG